MEVDGEGEPHSEDLGEENGQQDRADKMEDDAAEAMEKSGGWPNYEEYRDQLDEVLDRDIENARLALAKETEKARVAELVEKERKAREMEARNKRFAHMSSSFVGASSSSSSSSSSSFPLPSSDVVMKAQQAAFDEAAERKKNYDLEESVLRADAALKVAKLAQETAKPVVEPPPKPGVFRRLFSR